MIEFALLGPVEVAKDGEPLLLGRGKQRALLAILALNANEVISSDRLIDELWGEAPPETAAKALQVHVSQLRKTLEPERGRGSPGQLLVTRPPGYMLSVDPDQLDVTCFQRLASEGREALGTDDPRRAARLLGEALSLWRGPPLADLAYEPFAQSACSRLEELRLAVLEDRIAADLARGRSGELVGEIEALIAAHPLRERPRGQLMLALYRSGRQAEALEAYRAARAVLVEELGIEPGRELQGLHDAILRHDRALDLEQERDARSAPEGASREEVDVPPQTDDPFVGRERELEELGTALERAVEGSGSLYLIGGEPGIGKSRLAEETARRARQAGARTLWGRCWEAGGAPAYWPWVQALRSYVAAADPDSLHRHLSERTAEVTQLLPELRERFPDLPPPAPPESEGARFRLFDATAEFIKQAADDGPLALVLDDLHAADVPSLLMLRFIAGEIGDTAVFVLGTYRDVEVGPGHPFDTALTGLAREPAAHVLSLRGLDEGQVSTLIEASAEVMPSRRAVFAIHQDTGGNPLFVEELVRLLVSENRLEDAGGSGAARLGIPHGVHEVIGRRLEQVSDECRRTLAVAAVLGREFGLEELATLTGRPAGELLDVLDEALAGRIVSEAAGVPGRLRFSHVLIRDVLYEQLGMARRRRLHERAAQALEALHAADLDPHLAQLAHHFFEAGPAGDSRKAVAFARRAGDRASAQLAYEEAARFYELAIRVLRTAVPTDAAMRCQLLLALGDARLRAGDEEDAKTSFLEVAAIARQQGDAEALGRAALGYGGLVAWMAARGDMHLVPLLEEALASLPASDSDLRARLMARLSCAVRDQPDRARRLPLGEDAVAMARGLGDQRTLAYTLDARCVSMVDPDSLERLADSAREVVGIAAETGEVALTGSVSLFASLLQMGDVAGAKRALAAIPGGAGERHEPTYRWASASMQAALALLEGRYAAARPLIGHAYEVGRDAERFLAIASNRLQRFLLHRDLGGLELSERELSEAAEEYPSYHIFRSALANVYLELGHHEHARAIIEDLSRDGFEQVFYDEEFLPSMSLLAEACAAVGDLERAAAIYERLLPHAGRNAFGIIEFALGSVARPLGLLAGALGDTDAAADHLEEAIELNLRMGARPWVAHAKFDLGRTLGQSDGPSAGRPAALVSEALAEYRTLRMQPWERKAERSLAQLATPA